MADPEKAESRPRSPGGPCDPLDELKRRALWILVGLTAGALVLGWRESLSVALGGLLAIFNFVALRGSVDRVLGRRQAPGVFQSVGGFLGRLVLILGGLFAIFQLSFLSLIWALVGFSVFVLAGLVEAGRLLLRR